VPRPDPRTARVAALVRAHARARQAVATTVAARVRGAWGRLGNPYDDRDVNTFARTAGAAVVAGRARTANLTEAHLRLVLGELDGGPGRAHVDLPPLPRGIPLEAEYARPAEQFRYRVSLGATEDEAFAFAGRLAETLAETDLALAARDAGHRILADASKVTGWRRIIHPEMSRGGSCGLCVAAATRVYKVSELMPIHAMCACTIAPIVGSLDPGLSMNDVDLAALYRQVGGTAAAKLRKARFVVGQHGELGPTLLEPGQHFRGPADVPSAAV
jgi:hypothetical protein